jgi:hypothetical protein
MSDVARGHWFRFSLKRTVLPNSRIYTRSINQCYLHVTIQYYANIPPSDPCWFSS